MNTLKNMGGSCALFVSGVGATNIVTAISTAIIRRRAEPMSAKIAITVIPAERFFPITRSPFVVKSVAIVPSVSCPRIFKVFQNGNRANGRARGGAWPAPAKINHFDWLKTTNC